MNDLKVDDNKEASEAQLKTRWEGVMNLLNTSGEFFKITKPDKTEEWIRKDAIFSFRLSGSSMYLRVFGDSMEKIISFGTRWEALKLAEEIATALAREQK